MTTPHELMAKVNQLVGKGAVELGSSPRFRVEHIPTGVAPIDYLLGGGIPRGRMTEIYGNFSTLKSYIALRALAETQRSGGLCALIDTEHAYDSEWAERTGVDTKNLILQQPPNGETAIDTAEVLIRGGVDLLVIDSIAAILPAQEEGTKLSDKNVQPARLAALMSTGLRKLTTANTGRTASLWVNQTRNSVGVTFGNPERTPGGNAMKFYASYRVDIRKAGNLFRTIKRFDGETFKDTKETIGIKLKARLEKSKLSKPFGEVFFDYDLDLAEINELGFLVALAIEKGIVEKKGAMWTLDGGRPVRGREEFLRSVPEEHLRRRLGLGGSHSHPNGQDSPKRPVRLKPGASAATPVRGREASNGTVVTRKASTKSKQRGDSFLSPFGS